MREIKDRAQIDAWVEAEHIRDTFDTRDLSFGARRFAKGEIIASPDAPLRELLFLVEGAVQIYGIRADGSDGVSEVSYIMLETIEELHILQPGSAIHVSARTPERFLRAGCKVIRQGHGYPSVFNPDVYVQELMRQGKSLRDAREGGCSGCIEVGAFGKEAYVLKGNFLFTTISISRF